MNKRAAALAVLATGASLMGLAGNASADDIHAGGTDNTSLLGPVMVPVHAPGVAGNAAQNVPVTLCHTNLPILGVGLPANNTGGCSTSITNGNTFND
ncbi:hypothetical protein D5S17_17550 [Pseudonocardiaceae bacterium YIM PH 21723]|nr:hypothetical protein D5S17_17550 [Pseudonocardiaceae bacterium YIM PH 21723]